MNNVILFTHKIRRRENIESGYLTPEIIQALCETQKVLCQNYPNSWDVKFISSLLDRNQSGRKLSEKQIVQMERILQDWLFDEEYPNGMSFLFSSKEAPKNIIQFRKP